MLTSVKLSATPPAFKLTRNTVTPTLFTVHLISFINGHRAISRTEMLNGRIARLGAHRALQSADRKPGSLKPKRNQVQKVDKLAKNEALDCAVCPPEVGQFLDEGLNFGRRAPAFQVHTSKDSLSSLFCAIFAIVDRRSFEVNRERDVADGTSGLMM